MSRTKVRGALIALVMVGLTALGVVLGRTLSERQDAMSQAAPADLAPEVSQRVREFRRVKVNDGKKIWELKATEARYFEEKGEILVESPEVSFFGSDDRVEVTGAQGRMLLAGRDIERMELEGSIEVRIDDYVIGTPSAVYFRDRDAIVASEGVEVQGSSMSLTGQVLILDVEERRVRVLGDVITTFKRRDADSADAGPTSSVREERHAALR